MLWRNYCLIRTSFLHCRKLEKLNLYKEVKFLWVGIFTMSVEKRSGEVGNEGMCIFKGCFELLPDVLEIICRRPYRADMSFGLSWKHGVLMYFASWVMEMKHYSQYRRSISPFAEAHTRGFVLTIGAMTTMGFRVPKSRHVLVLLFILIVLVDSCIQKIFQRVP